MKPSRVANTAALDVGGANIKAAHASGITVSRRFEVWRDPTGLAAEIACVLQTLPSFERLGVTLTAEICDCFETKREGVGAVLDAAARALNSVRPHSSIQVWLGDGRLVALEDAMEAPLNAAAANWRALAEYAAVLAGDGPGIIADMGSTTTDLVPCLDGRAVPMARTDTERLRHRELVYTGLRRTPVHAVTPVLPYRDHEIPAIPELFATTADVHLIGGNIAEDEGDTSTADGRPLTREASRDRLARSVGADRETFTFGDAECLSRAVLHAQKRTIRDAAIEAARSLPGPPEAVVVSGEGERFLNEILSALWPDSRRIALSSILGPNGSEAACAVALAQIMADGRAERTDELSGWMS